MSTPMFEIPDHFEILVNEDGHGPVPVEEAVMIRCWCGNPECIQHITSHSLERIARDTELIRQRLEEEEPGFYEHDEDPETVKRLFEEARERGRTMIRRFEE